MMKKKVLLAALIILIFLSGCDLFPFYFTTTNSTNEEKKVEQVEEPKKQEEQQKDQGEQKEEKEPSPTPIPSPTPTPVPLGPDKYPDGVNPLTGLPVKNPENLNYPPVLASITNFPITARPQAGISFSPIIFEMWIGEGMTRFLSVFYGDYPKFVADQYDKDETTTTIEEPTIGPIRSGRLPYEYVRQLFSGYLLMASASKNVMAKLSEFSNVYGSDSSDVNSAMMKVSNLEKFAKANEKNLDTKALSGMHFDYQVPENGRFAQSLWIFFSYLNQLFWRYDEASGAYMRWQNDTDSENFTQVTDRLTEEPITYENVIVLFADHDQQAPTVIDIELLYVKRGKALLFRDGQMFDIYWTTASEEYEKTTGRLRPIRFVDAQGNPFPLKPGQTWIEIVPLFTPYWETVDSVKFHQLANGDSPGSGFWAVRIFNSLFD